MRPIFCSLIFLAVFISCNKEASNQQPAPNSASSLPLADTSLIGDTTIFFDVVIEAHRELQIQPLNSYGVYWTGVVPYTLGAYGLYEQGITNEVNHGLVLIKGNIPLALSDTSVLLKNQRMLNGFQPGYYPYTADPNDSSGVQIRWIDSTGKTWGSDLGIAVQANSKFQIINRINTDPGYVSTGITHGIYIRCIFNCTLYDDTGKVIQLKNGRMGISVWL